MNSSIIVDELVRPSTVTDGTVKLVEKEVSIFTYKIMKTFVRKVVGRIRHRLLVSNDRLQDFSIFCPSAAMNLFKQEERLLFGTTEIQKIVGNYSELDLNEAESLKEWEIVT
uniref:Uncharacterized protein n=1 Tax=Romanomermis culicivorax TaxID=13658 RepID=A0A915J1B7_ROMCU